MKCSIEEWRDYKSHQFKKKGYINEGYTTLELGYSQHQNMDDNTP